MVLSCKDIKMEFGAAAVLENVSFILEDGEKVALIGVNGAGKTTLLKIIMGEYTATGGEITFRKDASLGYLDQMKDLNPDNTIEGELLGVFSALISAENDMRDIESRMSALSGGELDSALEKYSRLQHYFEQNGGFEYRSRIKGVLSGLGFSADEAQMNISLLSGGQKTRVSLGKLLLSSPDILLLDEPTNHLDMESVTWLEDVFLAGFRGSVIIVTHDRYFIDKTASKIIEIEHGKSTVYNGGYSFYAYEKERERETALKRYMDQQKQIKKQEEAIRLLRSFNREKSIRRAESREKMLAKVNRLEKPESSPDKIRIVLEPKVQSGFDVLHAEGLSKSFGDFSLFKNIDIDIKRGEIVALIGANGIGKTTLFKMLLDMIPRNGGHIRMGTNVQTGYYDQEYAELDENNTIFGEISDAYPKLKDLEIRNVLASFVFFGDDVFKEIRMLSGGEKGRVALAKLILGGHNFLMLDEPTNHLDMFSKDVLEEALRNYAGTVFYISHDRYFINNTADKIIELKEDGAVTYAGDYEYYLSRKKNDAQAQNYNDDISTASKDDWMQKKEKQSDIRKKQSRIERIEKEISAAEDDIKLLEAELQKPEIFTDHIKANEAYGEKIHLEKLRDDLYVEWEELHG